LVYLKRILKYLQVRIR